MSDTVNFKDWVLGRGEFSEENLKKARQEFFTKLGKHWSELMLASVEKAFSDHDAVPEARADGQGRDNPATPDHVGTGNTPEPVAWMVQNDDGERWLCHNHPAAAKYGLRCVPLFAKPQPTLTPEERRAIEWCIEQWAGINRSTTLRKLLDRMK
jgi:hypothetical protein